MMRLGFFDSLPAAFYGYGAESSHHLAGMKFFVSITTFHLTALRTAETNRSFMHDEKELIRSTTEGFGKYILDHNGSRARNLPSARETILAPDEVWEECPIATTARWVYARSSRSLYWQIAQER